MWENGELGDGQEKVRGVELNPGVKVQPSFAAQTDLGRRPTFDRCCSKDNPLMRK